VSTAIAGRVLTDRGGRLTETGDPTRRCAVNCDIATPMEREGDSTFAVDLFTDVLVRQDATSYVVAPFGPCRPPRARPMRRGRVPARLLPGFRWTW
jgi:hypothetical protein